MSPEVAWVGHLSSSEAYRDALAAVRGDDLAPPRLEDVDRIVRRLSPMPMCELVVRSTTGAGVLGVYIDAFLLIDDSWGLRAAVRKVQAACAQAARSGARLGALGGFTSIVGERAALDLSAAHGIPFTTGNTLTAAVLAAQVRMAAAPGARVVVVGAAGDVGSGVCRLLHGDYPLTLVGRRPEPLRELAAELPGATPSTWTAAAPTADVAVLVASTAAGSIPVAGLRPDTVVLDAGHPPNAAPGHPLTVEAGRVACDRPTEGGLPEFTSHNCRPSQHHACMVEGAVLALEGWFEPYSAGRGHIQRDRADALLDRAIFHGLRPAPLRLE